MSTIIKITFNGGLGFIAAKLFRNGTQIDKGTTNMSGNIILVEAVKDDAISVDGVSPDDGTDITISVPTDPPTPDHYEVGPVFSEYDVK